MSLTGAIRTAQSALHTTAAQTAITSRNVAGASDPGYSRKLAIVATGPDGGSRTLTINRAADKSLFDTMIAATSRASSWQALVDGLNTLEGTLGDPAGDRSPAALVGALNDALQLYSATPSDLSLAQSAVFKANDLARSLNDATRAVQGVRQQADQDIASSVDDLNGLLEDFESVNNAIVAGTHAGVDITDKLDQRDKLLSQISEIIGVNMVTRGDNDAVIYTDSGVTLFETKARSVTFATTPGLGAAQTGNAVYVDGVPVTGNSATMPIKSGRLQGLSDLRDNATITYQSQLDEIARGLILTFAESDQSVPATLPDAPGLFTWSGAPAMPGSAWVPGLAGSISVNASVDPAQGGSLARLRDGGISNPGNPAYLYNSGGAASYSNRLTELLDKLGATQSFDPVAGIDSSASLGKFSAASVSWFELARQGAMNASDYSTTLVNQASDALSNATGVNLDDEMSLLLELEKSYQASSKLLAVINEMLAGFMAEIRYMKTTYVSTQGVSNATRRSVLQMQAELATLQKEISSGRAADVGLTLGARAGQTVALRRESASLQTLMDSNAVADLRLSTTQGTLGAIALDAQNFLGILVAAKDDATGAATTVQRAGEKLASLTGLLNTSQNGEYLFAGINSGAKPIADYSDPASPAKQAVANAFVAHFGFAQNDPAAANITAADMQDFLDNDLAALFDDPAWAANWSSASDQPVTSRISTAETVTTGVTANDPAMRKLAMAYTMVSDLGLAGLSQAAYGAVIAKATDLVGGAIHTVTSTQAQLGYSQQAVSNANTRMSAQKDMLETHIGSLEEVDPYEASTRINNLLTQIETSYALTARIQKLSLLDFL